MNDSTLGRLPIIRLWHNLLVVLQGDITDDLADRFRHDVLHAIHEQDTVGVVIDVTGVWIVDSHLCAVLSNIAAAARLMGTRTIISGMSPDVALTLQTMGVELGGIQTALTVEDALEGLGLRHTPLSEQAEHAQPAMGAPGDDEDEETAGQADAREPPRRMKSAPPRRQSGDRRPR